MKNTVVNRKYHMDLLRIVAIIFVIYNHTNKKGYFLYAFDYPVVAKVVFIVVAAIVAVAVPIFFMISGALLIPKEESIKDLYLKRVLRIVVIIIVFSVLMYGIDVLTGEKEFSLAYFFENVICDNITPSYWYLYAYLAYLICLPLIRKLAKNMSNAEFKYLFAILLIVDGVIKIVGFIITKDYVNLNSFFVIPFIENIIVYPLLGYYMEERVKEEDYTTKGMLKWIALMVIVLMIFVIMTLYRNMPYEEFTTYDKGLFTCSFTFILDVGIYYIAKMIFKGRILKGAGAKILTTLSGCVFGIYLIEEVTRKYTVDIYYFLSDYIGKFPSALIWCVIVFVISAIIIFLVKLIPGVKKFL